MRNASTRLKNGMPKILKNGKRSDGFSLVLVVDYFMESIV